MEKTEELFDAFLNFKNDEKFFLAWTAYLALETQNRKFTDRMNVLAVCSESDYGALRDIYDKINPQLSFVEMKKFLYSDKIKSWQKECDKLVEYDLAIFVVMLFAGALPLFTIEEAKNILSHRLRDNVKANITFYSLCAILENYKKNK